jgi:hypothetical protein
MKRKAFLLLFFSSSLFACGGSDVPSDLPVCGAHQFIVRGEVGGAPVDSKSSSEGGGFSQDNEGGDFGTQNNTRDSDAEVPDLTLAWSKSLNEGGSAAVSGKITLPAGTTGTSQTFCVGEGSRLYSEENGELRFLLTGLSSGSKCELKVAGSLQGCWRGR